MFSYCREVEILHEELPDVGDPFQILQWIFRSKEYNFGAFLDNILKEKCILGINDDRIIEVVIG